MRSNHTSRIATIGGVTSSHGPKGPAGAASRVLLAEVASRARPVTMAGEHVLPVLVPLAPLFAEGGLRRGSTVVVRPGAGGGATSLALAVAVAASQVGSWCAAVGWPALGMVAAAGLGMALERFALVPYPGDQWPAVVTALVDAVDVVLLQPPRGVRSSDARRLTARVRERGVVLVVNGSRWPEAADHSLSVAPAGWRGLGQGHGYLQARSVEVTATGRGAASRERRVMLWLPGVHGTLGALEKARVTLGHERPAPASAAG